MSAASFGLEKVPDSVGFMILNEDGRILSGGGELEGQERIAGILTSMVSHLVRLQKPDGSHLPFQRVSVVFDSFLYALTISNQKIFVVKKTHQADLAEEELVDTDESWLIDWLIGGLIVDWLIVDLCIQQKWLSACPWYLIVDWLLIMEFNTDRRYLSPPPQEKKKIAPCWMIDWFIDDFAEWDA